MSKRRTHNPEFKAEVGMEAISGLKTIQQIAADQALMQAGSPVDACQVPLQPQPLGNPLRPPHPATSLRVFRF
jgi:hypothetical protein